MSQICKINFFYSEQSRKSYDLIESDSCFIGIMYLSATVNSE